MEKFKWVHDSIKPSVWSPVTEFVWIQFGGWAARASGASPIGRWLIACESETHWAELYSDKFIQNSAVDQTSGLIDSWSVMGIIIIIHHYDISVWFMEWLLRIRVVDVSLWFFGVMWLIWPIFPNPNDGDPRWLIFLRRWDSDLSECHLRFRLSKSDKISISYSID